MDDTLGFLQLNVNQLYETNENIPCESEHLDLFTGSRDQLPLVSVQSVVEKLELNKTPVQDTSTSRFHISEKNMDDLKEDETSRTKRRSNRKSFMSAAKDILLTNTSPSNTKAKGESCTPNRNLKESKRKDGQWRQTRLNFKINTENTAAQKSELTTSKSTMEIVAHQPTILKCEYQTVNQELHSACGVTVLPSGNAIEGGISNLIEITKETDPPISLSSSTMSCQITEETSTQPVLEDLTVYNPMEKTYLSNSDTDYMDQQKVKTMVNDYLEPETLDVNDSNAVSVVGNDVKEELSLPLILPYYVKYEKVSDDNTVKLKGRHILKNVIDTHQPVDTILSLKDGKLGAHRIILVAVSPFLESLFQDQDFRVLTIIMPDITKKTMETLLNIAYTGMLTYSESDEDDVFSAIETLRFCEDVDLTVQRILKRKEPEEHTSPTPSCSRAIQMETADRSISNAEGQLRQISTNSENQCDFLPLGSLQCKMCYHTFNSYQLLQQHIDDTHNIETMTHGFIEEMRQLNYCTTCDLQHDNISRSQKCLKSHGLTRCWICLKEILKTDLRHHYQSMHRNKRMPGCYVKCRWCPKQMSVLKATGPFTAHCIALHLSKSTEPRRGTSSTNSVSNYRKRGPKRWRENNLSTGTTQNFKRTRLDVHEDVLDKDIVPSFISGVSKKTGKVLFDMNHFPKVSVALSEIPLETLNSYTSNLEFFIEPIEKSTDISTPVSYFV